MFRTFALLFSTGSSLNDKSQVLGNLGPKSAVVLGVVSIANSETCISLGAWALYSNTELNKMHFVTVIVLPQFYEKGPSSSRARLIPVALDGWYLVVSSLVDLPYIYITYRRYCCTAIAHRLTHLSRPL